MKFPKCQFENREKATFCLQCGGKLERNCPQCGNIPPVQASFCDECGYRLEERKEPPVIDFAKPHSYTPKHLADKILCRAHRRSPRRRSSIHRASAAHPQPGRGQPSLPGGVHPQPLGDRDDSKEGRHLHPNLASFREPGSGYDPGHHRRPRGSPRRSDEKGSCRWPRSSAGTLPFASCRPSAACNRS